jgi:hypothetical protein
MTPYGVDAAVEATWNNSGDFLARMGFQGNETKTHARYGTIAADYALEKTGSGGGGGSYNGIYGWSNDPLAELSILEGAFSPLPCASHSWHGDFSAILP